eukprot:4370075-Alexandrium_andersonii.AAC.1
MQARAGSYDVLTYWPRGTTGECTANDCKWTTHRSDTGWLSHRTAHPIKHDVQMPKYSGLSMNVPKVFSAML